MTGHFPLGRQRDDLLGLVEIVRHDDQHLDAGIEQLSGGLELLGVVAFAVADFDFRVQLLDTRDEQVAVVLPAFVLQTVEQQPDLDRPDSGRLRLGRRASATATGHRESRRHRQQSASPA